jgi:heterodisulfide reductase subunit B
MNLGYYPGCALHGSSNDYEQSLRACLGALDVTLAEIDDWTAAAPLPRTP